MRVESIASGHDVPNGVSRAALCFVLPVLMRSDSYYLLERGVLRLKNRLRRVPEGARA